MEQLQRASNALEETPFSPFRSFVRWPRDPTDFRPRRKTIVQVIFVAVDLPWIAPRPVNADATFTGGVFARDVRLVVRAGQCAHWHVTFWQAPSLNVERYRSALIPGRKK